MSNVDFPYKNIILKGTVVMIYIFKKNVLKFYKTTEFGTTFGAECYDLCNDSTLSMMDELTNVSSIQLIVEFLLITHFGITI